MYLTIYTKTLESIASLVMEMEGGGARGGGCEGSGGGRGGGSAGGWAALLNDTLVEEDDKS